MVQNIFDNLAHLNLQYITLHTVNSFARSDNVAMVDGVECMVWTYNIVPYSPDIDYVIHEASYVTMLSMKPAMLSVTYYLFPR